MSFVQQRELTDAMIDLLERGTGKLVGDHKAPIRPDGMPESDYFPHCILYAVPGTLFDGSLKDASEDALVNYQVTSVGLTRVQCEWMADRVRAVMLSRTPQGSWQVPVTSPAGISVNGRLPFPGFSGGIDIDGDPPYEVFSSPDRYIVSVTPDFP